MTLFGRDSLIVSLQNMLVNPGFSRGALRKLAQYQATEMDDWYGTADATPLYLIVLHEAWKWSGDQRLVFYFVRMAG